MRKLSVFFFLILALNFFDSGVNAETNLIDLPEPGFEIDYNRTELTRPARAFTDAKYEGPIADTHAHLAPPVPDIDEGKLQDVLKVMREQGIKLSIFMPTPNEARRPGAGMGASQQKRLKDLSNGEVKLFCGSTYLTRWLFDAYRYGYTEDELNSRLSRLSSDLKSGDYIGVGEIGVHHFEKRKKQNVIEYPPNFEPFIKVADLAAKKGVWLDLHIEPIEPQGKSHEKQVFSMIELLFRRNPKLKLVYSHTAMTNPTNVRRMLSKYPNIIMSVKIVRNHQKWRNLEPVTNKNGEIYEDWALLFEEMPDRFIIGSDAKFYRKRWPISKYKKKITLYRKMLATLNKDTAEKIAYQNAHKLFQK